MKDEALKLADSYEVKANFISEHHEKSGKLRMSTTNQATIKRHKKTADIIRRLVERIDSQEKHLKNKDDFIVTLIKPLSEETIEELREYHGINDWLYETSIVDFVRAVEKAHGIK